MWTNLLSGTIGSVIGAAVSLLVAFFTIRRTNHHQAELEAVRRRSEIAGVLAYRLVDLYDGLKASVPDGAPADALVPIDSLRAMADELRRRIVVDGQLLSPVIQDELRQVRKQLAVVITPHSSKASVRDLIRLKTCVRSAGEEVRTSRAGHSAL